MSKNKDKVKISFVGENATEVTGSMTLIEFNKRKILVDAGLYQGNNIANDYKINSRNPKEFKPKEIEYIFLTHIHIDHSSLIPKLYKDGCTAKIIVVKDSKAFMVELLKDSAYIHSKDAEYLTRKSKTKKEFEPLYTQDDVDMALSYIEEFNFNEIFKLDDELEFQFIPAGHIIRSAQIEIFIKQKAHKYKILFTGDLGNIIFDKPFCETFQRVDTANVVVGECTYSKQDRSVSGSTRDKDIEKIKSVISQVCLNQNGRLIIPSFSLDRSQMMLKILYDIYGKDKDFKIPIVLDSPLSIKLTDIYNEVLEGKNHKILQEVLSWKNLRIISDVQESKVCVRDKSPKIIISASGFLVAGRVRHYIKSILPDSKSHILFIGFATENSLAGKIKNGSSQKTISIDGKPYKNKCGITVLKSFSSHMQYEELLKYYSNINAEKICLVHSNFDDKVDFAKDLKELLEKKCKTTKVSCVNKSTVVSL